MAVAIIISTFGAITELILAGSESLTPWQKTVSFFRATGKLNSRAVQHRAVFQGRLDYGVVAASHAQAGRHVRQSLQRSSKLRGLRRFASSMC